MKFWFWVVLCLWLVVAMLTSCAKDVRSRSSVPDPTPPVEVAPSPSVLPSSRPQSSSLAPAPEIDPDRLLAHVEALNFRRFEPGDRERARTYIRQTLEQAGWTPRLQPFEGGVNVLAERSGTQSEAGAILLAAHYDTVAQSPGADDNASGVAAVLEIARLLHDRPTPRTLRLAFFDLEERGMGGSLSYAINPALRQDLQGVVVLEMVGFACYEPGCQQYPSGLPIEPPSDRGDFLAVIGTQENLPLLTAFEQAKASNLPPVFTLAVPLRGLLLPDLLRSDHAPFWYQGIGAVMVTDTANFRTPYYHQPGDTPANLDRPFFTGATQIAIKAVTALLEGKV